MEIQFLFILTACIVSFKWMSIQAHNKIVDRAVTRKVNDESEIQGNFQNLFNSIAKKNTNKSVIYHEILKQEAARERQGFNAMKEDLQDLRNKNTHKKRNFYKKSDNNENLIASKRETKENNGGTDETQSTARPPIDLNDIGYGKTWEKFCDVTEIQDDFPEYPHHDLRRLRILICRLKMIDKLDRNSMPAFAAYKLCNIIRPSIDYFFDELRKKFADNDDEKEGELLAEEKNVNSECYNETMKVFTKKCMGPQHVCNRMLKDLLNRGCVMPWLTTQTIIAHINDVCDGRFVSDETDWDSIFLSIKYME